MDVNINNFVNGKKLSELKAGECFTRGSDVFIKTDMQDEDGDIQVVDLKDGTLHRYPSDNEVYVIDVVLSEKGKQLEVPVFGRAPAIRPDKITCDNVIKIDDK